jgi:hypothetical protein
MVKQIFSSEIICKLNFVSPQKKDTIISYSGTPQKFHRTSPPSLTPPPTRKIHGKNRFSFSFTVLFPIEAEQFHAQNRKTNSKKLRKSVPKVHEFSQIGR